MKPLPVSKPFTALAILLLAVQMACAASSISPSPTPATVAPSAQPTNTAATQTSPTASSPGAGATQSVPATGGQATQPYPPTSTGEHASAAEAQAMLKSAVQHYQTVGRDQALMDFTDKKPPFSNADLFILCLGSDHRVSAMGGFPLLAGVSADSLNDVTGKPIGKLVWDAASADPQGSIPFHWKNPLSGQAESRTLYYQKLDQDVCGVAAANP